MSACQVRAVDLAGSDQAFMVDEVGALQAACPDAVHPGGRDEDADGLFFCQEGLRGDMVQQADFGMAAGQHVVIAAARQTARDAAAKHAAMVTNIDFSPSSMNRCAVSARSATEQRALQCKPQQHTCCGNRRAAGSSLLLDRHVSFAQFDAQRHDRCLQLLELSFLSG